MSPRPGGVPPRLGDSATAHLDDLSRLAERRFRSSLTAVSEVLRLAADLSGAVAMLVRFGPAGEGVVLAAAGPAGAPEAGLAPGDPAPLRWDGAADPVPLGWPAGTACAAARVGVGVGDDPGTHLCVVGPGPFGPDRRDPLGLLARLLATQFDRDRELGLRERVEADLREREGFGRALVRNAGDLFLVLGPDGLVRYASPAAERLLGWSPADLVGRLPPEVGMRDPEDRAAYAAALAADRETGPLPTVVRRLRHRDGGWRTFEIARTDLTADPTVRGILAVARDVSERTEAEAALAAERRLLAGLMDTAPDPLYVTDAALRFRRLNPAAAEQFGLADPEAAVGRTVVDVTPSPAAAAMLAVQASVVASGDPALNRLERWDRPGGTVWRLASVVPLRDADGAVSGVVGLSRDVTELRRAEAEMAAALAAQRTANEELERLNRVKSDFVAVISHEFRTPLTSIQGFSELIRDVPMPPDEMRECADEVNRAAVRLARMIDGVLDLDRLQRGHARLRAEPVDLGALLREAVDALRPTTAAHGFRLAIDPGMAAVVADRDRLFQVATNLLGNAVKYAPAGGEVVVAASRHDGAARFSVRDEGIGIPPEALEQVFERYARIESVTGRAIQGTGLGLPIVREIVELHGGRVWAEANHDRGVTFHVELPAPSVG